MLIDSHCHLDFPDFADDLDGVIARAGDAGVGAMLTIGTRLSAFDGVLAVARRYDNVWCSVGIHPHEAENESGVAAAALVERARDPKVIGIGETGLDYFYEHAPRDAQAANFRAHIAASRETGLPLIVHARDADGDIAAILRDEYAKGPFPGLIHCFTSSRGLAEAALGIGFSISFSGILTFRKADDLRAVAAAVPLDRLLVETDAPYLAPVPHRGKRNEPSFVPHTAKCLAAAKGVSAADIEKATTENFLRLFARANLPAV